MIFAWIRDHKSDWPTAAMCEALNVSRSGYYAWRDRPPSPRAQRRAKLDVAIRVVHEQSRNTYGSPRVHRELKSRGVACSENTVARRMRENGLYSKVKRRFNVRTTDANHPHAVAPNTLDRAFRQEAPDRVWAADITYVPTDQGWLYLAVVVDLFSRRVVGWATADHLRAELAIEALHAAVEQRGVEPGLLHHSDRGVQYACEAYRTMLDAHGMTASMSRTGNCYDNAVVESFFKTLKAELVHHEHYATHTEARQSIFEYIEVFYNRQRLHSALNYLSPLAFEQHAA